MPYSVQSPPKFAKNYTDAEKKVASEAANRVLSRGGTEEEAIFAAISATKAYRKQQKASQNVSKAFERKMPSHLSAILNKSVVEPVEASKEILENKPTIKQAFLGKGALQTGIERNLVSVNLADNLELLFTFDTGEQIKTDLSKVQGNIENYVHITNQETTSSGSANSTSVAVNTTADVPLVVNHGLNLADPEAIIIQANYNGQIYSVDVQILDGNNVEIVTYFDTINLRLNFIGV